MSERSVNKVILVGTVGRDPETHDTDAGKVGHFSLATNRAHRGEEEARTEWHRLTVRGNLARFAQDYVNCGDRIYVEGAIEYGSYELDGITIPSAEVVVREIVLLRNGKSST